jgi:hypothetical protein
MTEKPYKLWAALVVEIYRTAVEKRPALALVPGLTAIIDQLMPHWLEWRTQQILEEVDRQAEQITLEWEAMEQQAQAPIVSEVPPDGSQAQALLGGELRIGAPWAGREVGYDREE